MLTIPFILLVFATFVTLAAVGANLVVLPLLRAVEPVPPRWRGHFLFLIAAAPWLVGASVLLSSLGDIAFGACDIGNACLWNEDPSLVEPIRTLIISPLVVALIFLSVKMARQVWVARQVTGTLDAASIAQDDGPIRIVQDDTPLAVTSHRRIYLSRSLAEHLSPEQYRAVVLHEHAHLTWHDGWFRAVASVLTACYLPPLRRRLLAALTLATEEACDESAAAEVGRDMTAAAILAVERLSQGFPSTQLQGFTDDFVAVRVARLLGLRPIENHDSRLLIIVVSTILFGFLFSDILYYVTMLILYPTAID